MQHIWLVNHYASLLEKDGSSGRHEALAKEMLSHGWSTTIIAASTSHPDGTQSFLRVKRRRHDSASGVDTLLLWAPHYVSNGARRALNMVIFTLNLLLPGATRGLQKPDLVVGSTVHLLAAWAGAVLARRHKVPFVFEIRDVWPETLIDMGKLGPHSPAARLMRRLSKSLCTRAELVFSPLPGIRSYLDENGFAAKDFVWVSNGVDLKRPLEVPPPADDTHATFMYLGSHGYANALHSLLEAFDLAYRRSGDLLRLRLVGSGPLKTSLKALAGGMESAPAISFEDKVPRQEVIGLAQQATALVATMGDHPVYRFGISLNKLFDYLQAGRPIVFASNAFNNPVDDASAGITVAAEDVDALADALLEMASTPAHVRDEMGANGMRHVCQEYSYSTLAAKLADALQATTQTHSQEKR